MEGYQLVARVGAGSFATVWKARRRADGRLVAIKQLKAGDTSWDDLMKMPEVRYLRGLSHPNVLGLQSVVRLRGATFMVMDYCEANVYEVMQAMAHSGRRFTEPEIRWIVRQMLLGLAYIHGVGLMHRDVKPDNVLLCSNTTTTATAAAMGGGGAAAASAAAFVPRGVPCAKICDFGQATPVSSPRLTGYVSTRWYRAPEVLLRCNRYGPAVDVFAVGVTMIELLTLRPAFPGTSEVGGLGAASHQSRRHTQRSRACDSTALPLHVHAYVRLVCAG